MKIIIAAGGTGGHIYPGIALAEELKQKDPANELLFIGSNEGLEKKLVKFPIRLIYARGLMRKISWKAATAPFVTLFGLFQSIVIIKRFNPDWVITTGGYVSLPVILAGWLLKVPVLLHEQNVLPGFTNRFCSRFAKIITLSFEESRKYLNGLITGNPIRKRIFCALNKVPGEHFNVLVIGGSQGSRNINNALIEQLDQFNNSGITITHVTGERDYSILPRKKYSFYNMLPYMYNIEEGLQNADLVVSRAGATAISEILVCGKPSVLIPFPYSAEGHQKLNAKVVASNGAAITMEDHDLGRLSEVIKDLAKDREKIKAMGERAQKIAKPDAAKKIVELLYAKN